MLISRGLRTLLLGLTVLVFGGESSPSIRHTRTQQPSREGTLPEVDKASRIEAQVVVSVDFEGSRRRGSGQPRVRLRDGQGVKWTANGRRRKRQNTENEEESPDLPSPSICGGTNNTGAACQELSICCPGANGDFQCCSKGFSCCVSGNGEAACCADIGDVGCGADGCSQPPLSSAAQVASLDAPPAIFVTRTITATVTSFTGTPETSVFITTRTEVLTFLNPTQQTQTETVTTTRFFRRARRAEWDQLRDVSLQEARISSRAELPEPVVTQRPRLAPRSIPDRLLPQDGHVQKRQEGTVTSTTTTTIFTQSRSTATITNVVFSTRFVAPNAVTTVFVTTTIFLPSASSTMIISVPASTTFTSSGSGPTSTLVPDGSSTTRGSSSLPPLPSSSFSSEISSTSSSPSDISSTSSMEISSTSSMLPSTPLLSSTEVITSAPSTTTTMTGDMETMMSSASGTNSPTPVPGPGSGSPGVGGLSSNQIVGIVLGAIFGFLFLILLAFLLRKAIQRRRRAQAQMRQQLTPPEAASAAGLDTGGTGNSDTPSGNSGLTGQGEVRVVIRPAPKRRTQSSQLWPMPPGRAEQSYSLFVEETTTGATTPQDPGAWSIASERGSVRDQNISNSNNGGNGSSSGGRPSMGATGRDGTMSYISVGWDTSLGGGRSDVGSYPGPSTLLTPPPASHAGGFRGVRLDEEDDGSSIGSNNGTPILRGGSGYPMGSFGIGKAR
ncbi:hypothetical protein B0H63DRAFT_511477 [Podospora didyma]|uniref:Uncharacterized protein n=1 Tax=Podospora didyma TaxID=330526 RepID=A0AAE0TW60_9PEZI|nr:hypothetical protein B0H63DRAFT_511477 [Podospora didyma]